MFQERYRRILWFFGRAILSFIWWDIILFRIGFRGWVRNTRKERFRRIAKSFRLEAIRMGGVMIKVGQFLSARLDVLPREITDELSGLQDEVRPESLEDMRKVIETEFGMPLEAKFDEFQNSVVASASIGQVYLAKLKNLDPSMPIAYSFSAVAVKIQRPHIEEIIATDLAALRVVARWLMRYGPIRKRADVPALLEEFSSTLNEEVDYLHEGKNAEIFAHNFENRPEIRVPRVIWSHTTRRVLTLEYIEAIKITDYAAITAAGIDRSEVAARLFDTYLKQIFEDEFFHGDPHPGNLFVRPDPLDEGQEKRTWKLVFVDFGIAGTITPTIVDGLREGLIAIGTRDASRLIKAYKILDVLLPGADVDLLERASSRVFESFWGKTAPEMMQMRAEDAREFVNEFSELVYEMPFQAPDNIIMLVRCLGILSGICTGLDPGFNIWTSIVPYAERIVQSEFQGSWRFWLAQIGDMATLLLSLPKKTETLLNRMEQGKLEVKSPELVYRINRLERSTRRFSGAIVFAAFLVTSVQSYLAGQLNLAIGLGIGAFLAFGWILFAR
ncbi:MAG TPA: AarF/UbiB family protein [Anaerolineaceae bacterium]|nr:AarF/UbiB family protein [Anaerolineaceae bacterium]